MRGRPRSATADAAILQAGLELFLIGGVEAANFEQIAKRAGVSKVTVYRRWSSKEDLLAHAIETARTRLVPEPAGATEATEARSLEELFLALLPILANALRDPELRAMATHVIGAGETHPRLLEAYWIHYARPRRDALRRLLGRARDEGRIGPETDDEALIDMIVGGLIYRMLQPGRPDRVEAEAYVRAVLGHAGLLREKE